METTYGENRNHECNVIDRVLRDVQFDSTDREVETVSIIINTGTEDPQLVVVTGDKKHKVIWVTINPQFKTLSERIVVRTVRDVDPSFTTKLSLHSTCRDTDVVSQSKISMIYYINN